MDDHFFTAGLRVLPSDRHVQPADWIRLNKGDQLLRGEIPAADRQAPLSSRIRVLAHIQRNVVGVEVDRPSKVLPLTESATTN